MGIIDLAANAFSIAATAAFVAMVASWFLVIWLGLRPAIHRGVDRAGLGYRPARVHAALVHHEEVCASCGYPRAGDDCCPECGRGYAYGGLARRAEVDARAVRRRRAARRRAVWLSVLFWLMLGSGWLAAMAYALVNIAIWGGAFPEVVVRDGELSPFRLAAPTNWPRPTGTYTVHVKVLGVVADAAAAGPRPLLDARGIVWIERDDGPAPSEPDDQGRWPALPGGPEGDAVIEALVERAYRAAGLDQDGEERAAEKIDAAVGVAMVRDGTHRAAGFRSLRSGAPHGLIFRGLGTGAWPPPSQLPLLPAALAGAFVGGLTLVGGLLLTRRLMRRSASAEQLGA